MNNTILAIDDEEEFLFSLKRALFTSGFKAVTLVKDPATVSDILRDNGVFDIALIDITMPYKSGIEILSLIKNISPFTECIMITARNEARIAVECLKKGAYDYLVKPIRPDDLIRIINHALEKKRLLEIVELSKKPIKENLVDHPAFSRIITGSSKMFRLLREAQLHSISEMPVLISGESGTGKELLARAIHDASPRVKGPFTPINMASLSESLFESAFFGHAKGAFTGAQNAHMGFLEATHGGTLFLDEIGTLPLELQGKLLRVLQEKEFIKLGTSSSRSADVRFVAATNADLHQLMAAGLFRKDFYYRLQGAQLHLPPLRERREDIPLLVHSFLEEFKGKQLVPAISEEAMVVLFSYDFPGNIRELRGIIQAACNLSQGRSIDCQVFPPNLRKLKKKNISPPLDQSEGAKKIVTLSEMEKAHIRNAMRETGGNLTHTANLLGICLNTLRRKLSTYGIERK